MTVVILETVVTIVTVVTVVKVVKIVKEVTVVLVVPKKSCFAKTNSKKNFQLKKLLYFLNTLIFSKYFFFILNLYLSPKHSYHKKGQEKKFPAKTFCLNKKNFCKNFFLPKKLFSPTYLLAKKFVTLKLFSSKTLFFL